jgi:hypothetical protein
LVPATIWPQIDRDQFLVAQLVGHVALDDALRQAFHDGGLADAGFADQHRIVLGAAAQHLHDAADLFVAADHGVELAAPRLLGQIDGVAFERLVFRFRILIGHALRAAHGHQRFQNGVVVAPCLLSRLPAGSYFWSAMPSSRCSVETYSSLKRFGFLESGVENLLQGRAQCTCRWAGPRFWGASSICRCASATSASG